MDDDPIGEERGPMDAGAGGAGGGFVIDASVPLGGQGGETSMEVPPYVLREGSFKVLGFSKTNGIRTSSIPEGQQMLLDLAAEHGFEVDLTEDSTVFTAEGLEPYELVFFLNTSGDVLNDSEQAAFETWILDAGAFVGTSRAADTEKEWTFYHELTGQYYDLHAPCCIEQAIEWMPNAGNFPGVSGLPSPWTRAELWFYFDSYAEWSSKVGFRILATTVLPRGEGTVTVPVSFIREWASLRSFYTVLGHQEGTFTDDLVRQHILGGMLWTVHRGHWLD